MTLFSTGLSQASSTIRSLNPLTISSLSLPDLRLQHSPNYQPLTATILSSTASYQASSIARPRILSSSIARVHSPTLCGSVACTSHTTGPINPLRDPRYPQPARNPRPRIDGTPCRSASLTITLAASTAQLSDPDLATVTTTQPVNTVLPPPSVVGLAAHDQLKTLLNSFPDLFAWSTDTIGRAHLIQHTIDTRDAKPVWQPPPRIPVRYREEVNKMLDELLQAKIIQPSSSPWASPIALVPKKDGSARLCIDYSRLNAVTVHDSFPLPRLDDTLDALGNAAWFSTLDLKSGSANELHGDININIAAPSFSPVHFDEAKGPANDAQTAENRGMLNRDHCIIIQGLPESSASTPRERVAADLEQFQKLLNEMLNQRKMSQS
ncbi:hypothetical protein SprV_0200565300 [Sparganum proliferum]